MRSKLCTGITFTRNLQNQIFESYIYMKADICAELYDKNEHKNNSLIHFRSTCIYIYI